VAARVGFLEAIRLQQEADVLLMLGSSDLAYSPSKLYLYYLTQRPMLGVVFEDSVLRSLLEELACAYLVSFREHAPKTDAHEGLFIFFDALLSGRVAATQPVRNDALFRQRFLALP
jgi:hypothetical protein